jgi:PPM family protein phosphatase
MRLQVGAGTNVGRVRDLNEDAYLSRTDLGLFVVCDGMGGCAAGEIASQLAIEMILRQLEGAARESFPSRVAEDDRCLPQTRRLADAVQRSNQHICAQAAEHPDHAGMGSTVVSAWITECIASVAHVGDSRAYLWRDDELEPLTRDHSLVEAYARAGVLDRETSLHAEEQNILLRVLGRQPQVDVDVNEVLVQPGDYLLLCSDGLTRMVEEPIVAHAIGRLRDPQRVCDHLIDAANRNGGEDNITVVVVQVIGDPWWRLWNAWRIGRRGGRHADAHATA